MCCGDTETARPGRSLLSLLILAELCFFFARVNKESIVMGQLTNKLFYFKP